jgi:putative N-acetylmannosamine-6-phosphate epimerase
MHEYRSFVLPRGLIVSCQAYEGEPLFGAHLMAAMARAAAEGGAVGIRANSPADIAAIRQVVSLPIIGLYKIYTPPLPVYITPTTEAAAAIAQAGANVIAIDATPRPRQGGVSLAELVGFIHHELGKPVMADISCREDAELAASLGVEILSTTLAGYTEHGRLPTTGPDLELLAELARHFTCPVVAEGRFRTPQQLRQAFELGAQAVVIGAAITRPQDITRWFVAAIPSAELAAGFQLQ